MVGEGGRDWGSSSRIARAPGRKPPFLSTGCSLWLRRFSYMVVLIGFLDSLSLNMVDLFF